MIYKYQKTQDQYTDYTATGESLTELSTVDGWTYFMIPDGVELPEQTPQVQATLTVADLTQEQETAVKSACPPIALKLATIRQQAQDFILNKYPLWMQANVANGIYPLEVADPIKAHIAAIIVESNRCENAIVAAATIEDAMAVTPEWPETGGE